MTLTAIEIYNELELEIAKPQAERNSGFIETYISSLKNVFFPAQESVAEFLQFPEIAHKIACIYSELTAEHKIRNQLLLLFTVDGFPQGLATFADLMVKDPPPDAAEALPAFAALFQKPPSNAQELFPQLLDALEHQQIAPMVLDLANHYVRAGLIQSHPAASRLKFLGDLFSSIVQQLHLISEKPLETGLEGKQIPQKIDQAVSIVVALANTFVLIDDDQIVGKLMQAVDLRHRRVATQVAAALAHFKQDAGVEQLVAMTKEPVVRQRALFHLEELGLLDKVEKQYKSAQARAESSLVLWLADPLQFGFPPSEIEPIDHCHQFWPGYEDKQDCYLFRYVYHLPSGELKGIGISGPVIHSMAVDLQDFPPADIYAIFAGWQAEHELISEIAHGQLSDDSRETFDSYQTALEKEGYSAINPIKKGQFFDETHWVFEVQRDQKKGSLIVDQNGFHWFATATSPQPIGPHEAYQMHKGRLLLRQFNS